MKNGEELFHWSWMLTLGFLVLKGFTIIRWPWWGITSPVSALVAFVAARRFFIDLGMMSSNGS